MKTPKARRRAAGACIAAAALTSLPSISRAVTSQWTFNGSGNWSVASNWLGGVPGAGYDVYLVNSDAINRTINYDYGGTSVQLNSMFLDRSGPVWVYTPRRHKTLHHGHTREIYLGPKAQAVLTPWLVRQADPRRESVHLSKGRP